MDCLKNLIFLYASRKCKKYYFLDDWVMSFRLPSRSFVFPNNQRLNFFSANRDKSYKLLGLKDLPARRFQYYYISSADGSLIGDYKIFSKSICDVDEMIESVELPIFNFITTVTTTRHTFKLSPTILDKCDIKRALEMYRNLNIADVIWSDDEDNPNPVVTNDTPLNMNEFYFSIVEGLVLTFGSVTCLSGKIVEIVRVIEDEN